jgi:aminoglycoside phosphotransferase (APT) family kinase protein
MWPFNSRCWPTGFRSPRPILTASGKPVIVGADGTGYRVYEWVDFDDQGRVASETAGELLARIHGVEWPPSTVDPWFYDPGPDDRSADWVAEAAAAEAPWADRLARAVEEILATTAGMTRKPPSQLISCHLDFNRENVLLDRAAHPWVIDWENSGGGDPAQELVQTIVEFAIDDPAGGADLVDAYRAAGIVTLDRANSILLHGATSRH